MSNNYYVLAERLWPSSPVKGTTKASTDLATNATTPSEGVPESGETELKEDKKLSSNNADYSKRLRVALEIRERMDVLYSMQYGKFLKAVFPAFRRILSEVPISHDSQNVNHRLRNTGKHCNISKL